MNWKVSDFVVVFFSYQNSPFPYSLTGCKHSRLTLGVGGSDRALSWWIWMSLLKRTAIKSHQVDTRGPVKTGKRKLQRSFLSISNELLKSICQPFISSESPSAVTPNPKGEEVSLYVGTLSPWTCLSHKFSNFSILFAWCYLAKAPYGQ